MSTKRFPDTGYPVDEAIRKAEAFWNEFRGAVSRDFNATTSTRLKTGAGAPMLRFVTTEQEIPNGILSGKPWAELTEAERVIVTRTWHDQQVRRPMLDKGDPTGTTFQVLTLRCDHPHHPPQVPIERRYEAITQTAAYQNAKAEGWVIRPKFDWCPVCSGVELFNLPEENLFNA